MKLINYLHSLEADVSLMKNKVWHLKNIKYLLVDCRVINFIYPHLNMFLLNYAFQTKTLIIKIMTIQKLIKWMIIWVFRHLNFNLENLMLLVKIQLNLNIGPILVSTFCLKTSNSIWICKNKLRQNQKLNKGKFETLKKINFVLIKTTLAQ